MATKPTWQGLPLGHTGPALQLELIAPALLYGRTFVPVAGQPLTGTDQRPFAELTTLYVRAQCPEHRGIPFSLGWAARVIGHDTLGGETRRLVRALLSRLRSVTVESALREPDEHETVLGWGLLDLYLTTSRGGTGSVTLSEEIPHLPGRTAANTAERSDPNRRAVCGQRERRQTALNITCQDWTT